jgi:hypothetical protein
MAPATLAISLFLIFLSMMILSPAYCWFPVLTLLLRLL